MTEEGCARDDRMKGFRVRGSFDGLPPRRTFSRTNGFRVRGSFDGLRTNGFRGLGRMGGSFDGLRTNGLGAWDEGGRGSGEGERRERATGVGVVGDLGWYASDGCAGFPPSRE